MNSRALLRKCRQAMVRPAYLFSTFDQDRLSCWRGSLSLLGLAYGRALRFATSRCLLRTGAQVYMSAASFISLLLGKSDVFIDVGAYEGMETILGASIVGRTGQVHTFEPNPVPFGVMAVCICLYGFDWCTLNQCALGAREGIVSLYIPRSETGASLKRSEDAGMGSIKTIECQQETLDSYTRRHGIIDRVTLVKIDVEGAELDVLRGGANLFSGSTRPMVVFEAAPNNANAFGRTVNDTMEWLAARGYHFYVLRYPNLVSAYCEADLGLTAPGTDPWTDVLALVPELHETALQTLCQRFPLHSEMV